MTTIKRSVRRRAQLRRIALVTTAVTAGLVLTACGSGSDTGNSQHHDGKASATATPNKGENPAPGQFNDADVMFAQMMIPHHQQAMEMSELVDGRAEDAEIKELAAEIAKAQGPEIEKMRSWLKAWGKPESPSSMPGMDHGSGGMEHGSGGTHEMSGMMTAKDMKELKAAKGTDFDKKFAEMMIGHHDGAIDMAKDEQQNGKNATAKKLAADVVKGQSTEVEQLKKILDRL
ncbi:DUF305 domain-containing protein [Streptomyces violens]|uniref:DUF305 domain-containing protein n=1 Tax=Streptomyces violens TaxID=66377 RepID=UPI0004C163A7|nr:DUF305 domain-containing protein [Streptomyces violens]